MVTFIIAIGCITLIVLWVDLLRHVQKQVKSELICSAERRAHVLSLKLIWALILINTAIVYIFGSDANWGWWTLAPILVSAALVIFLRHSAKW